MRHPYFPFFSSFSSFVFVFFPIFMPAFHHFVFSSCHLQAKIASHLAESRIAAESRARQQHNGSPSAAARPTTMRDTCQVTALSPAAPSQSGTQLNESILGMLSGDFAGHTAHMADSDDAGSAAGSPPDRAATATPSPSQSQLDGSILGMVSGAFPGYTGLEPAESPADSPAGSPAGSSPSQRGGLSEAAATSGASAEKDASLLGKSCTGYQACGLLSGSFPGQASATGTPHRIDGGSSHGIGQRKLSVRTVTAPATSVTWPSFESTPARPTSTSRKAPRSNTASHACIGADHMFATPIRRSFCGAPGLTTTSTSTSTARRRRVSPGTVSDGTGPPDTPGPSLAYGGYQGGLDDSLLTSQFPPNELLPRVTEDQCEEDVDGVGRNDSSISSHLGSPLGGPMLSPISQPGGSQGWSPEGARTPRLIACASPSQGVSHKLMSPPWGSQGTSPRQPAGGSQLDDSILGMLSGSFPMEKEPNAEQPTCAGQTNPTPAPPPTRLAAADESGVNQSLLGMLSGSFPAQPATPASSMLGTPDVPKLPTPGPEKQTPTPGTQPPRAGVMEIKVYGDAELASFTVLSEQVSYKPSGFSPMRLTPTNGGNEPCVVACMHDLERPVFCWVLAPAWRRARRARVSFPSRAFVVMILPTFFGGGA